MSLTKSYQCTGQLTLAELFPDSWCGKTYPEPLAPTKEKTSELSSKKQRGSKIKVPLFLDLRENKNGVHPAASWVMGGPLLGEYTMLSFGEFPSDVKESHLSQILEEHPLPKYSLSVKACQGILRRAESRGKQLPTILEQALKQQATLSRYEGGVEIDSKGKRAGKGPLVQTELSGTLGVSQDQTLITKCLNSWDVQSKHIQPENGIAETLYSGECRHGGGESYVMQKCYGISSYDSNSMKSNNPHSGIYEADTTRTLDLNGGNPTCNQGGMAICIGNGQLHDAMAPSCEVSKTLNCLVDPMKIVTYGIDRASFNQGKNAQYNFSVEEDLAQTIVAKGPGGGTEQETVGALCARDYKGVGSQYVNEGKVIIQKSI